MYGARARTHGSEPDRADDEMEPRVRKAIEKGPSIVSIVSTVWRAIVGDYVDGVVAIVA